VKKISIVLATYNEEENIRRCLDSVKGWVDEIVIVDGTSSDNTVKIAEEEYRAKVLIKPNQKNFHINKQIAIDTAISHWILQLDADEVVSKPLRNEIEEILKDEDKYNGYWIPRKNWFLGRFLMKGGQYPDYTLRLYKNGKGKLPQRDVHEQAVVEGEVGYFKQALLHYPYKNFSFYITKWNRYNKFEGGLIKEKLNKKNLGYKIFEIFDYLFFRPVWWFLWVYLRHKGFMDGWQGFVFAFFSSVRFPVSFFYSTKKT
jgi:glycosyltransferase involved in cell wall biosynthesis